MLHQRGSDVLRPVLLSQQGGDGESIWYHGIYSHLDKSDSSKQEGGMPVWRGYKKKWVRRRRQKIETHIKGLCDHDKQRNGEVAGDRPGIRGGLFKMNKITC